MVTACFKDVVESDEVGFDVSIRIGDAVAYASLCCKVHNYLWIVLGKEVFDELFVGNIALYKVKVGILLTLPGGFP